MFHLKQILSHLPSDEKDKLKENEHEIQGMHLSTTKSETNKQVQKRQQTNRQQNIAPASHHAQLLQLLLAPPRQVIRKVKSLPVKMELFVHCFSIFVWFICLLFFNVCQVV